MKPDKIFSLYKLSSSLLCKLDNDSVVPVALVIGRKVDGDDFVEYSHWYEVIVPVGIVTDTSNVALPLDATWFVGWFMVILGYTCKEAGLEITTEFPEVITALYW